MGHRIALREADEFDKKHYKIMHVSARVWRVKGSHSPTRVVVWGNVDRPNPHPGMRKWTEFGSIGGDGRYLDPNNKGTDEEVSVLLSPESSVISAHGDGTGTEASGQVWAEDHEPFATGDVLVLVYPGGREETRTVQLTNNGHGEAK